MEKTHNYGRAEAEVVISYQKGEMPLHMFLKKRAKTAPNDIACIFYDKEVSWSELDEKSDKLASFLKSKQLEKGDRIGLYLLNCPQYIIAQFAIWKIGAIAVPVNPELSQEELEQVSKEFSLKAMVAAQELYPLVRKVRDNIPSLEFVITTNYVEFLPVKPGKPLPDDFHLMKIVPVKTYDFYQIVRENALLEETAEIDLLHDIALLTVSKDCEGKWMGESASYKQIAEKAFELSNQVGEKAAGLSLSVRRFGSFDGMTEGINEPVFSARPSVILTSFNTRQLIHALQKYQCTLLYCNETWIKEILKVESLETEQLDSLKVISLEEEPTEELLQHWKKLAPSAELIYNKRKK